MGKLIEKLCSNLITDSKMKNTILSTLDEIKNQNKKKEENRNNESNKPIQKESPQQEKDLTVINSKVTNQLPTNNKLIKVRKSPCLTSDQELSGIYRSVINGFQEMKKLKANNNIKEKDVGK